MVGEPKTRMNPNTIAVGNPTICDAYVFGIKIKALVDTGSVISIVPATLLRQAKLKALTWTTRLKR